jgi:hypothetical protein
MIIALLMIWVADGTSGAIHVGTFTSIEECKKAAAKSMSVRRKMLRSTLSCAFEPNRTTTAVTCDPSILRQTGPAHLFSRRWFPVAMATAIREYYRVFRKYAAGHAWRDLASRRSSRPDLATVV